MKRLILIIILAITFPSTGFSADAILENERLLDERAIYSDQKNIQLHHGNTSLVYVSDSIEGVQFKKSTDPQHNEAIIPFFESVAEASPLPVTTIIDAFVNAHGIIQTADTLDDIKPVVAQKYHKNLSDKVEAKSNELIVLLMTKNIRPEKAEVLDVQVTSDEEARMIVKGMGVFGLLHGVIDMTKEQADWKLAHETWFVEKDAGLKENVPILKAIYSHVYDKHRTPDKNMYERMLNAADYSTTNKFLPLQQVKDTYTKKDMFMFMFFVDWSTKVIDDIPNEIERTSKPKHVHILWTGPRHLLPKQKLFKNENYPVGVSIAHHKDGYMPGELNLRLPKKKPKAVSVGLFFKF